LPQPAAALVGADGGRPADALPNGELLTAPVSGNVGVAAAPAEPDSSVPADEHSADGSERVFRSKLRWQVAAWVCALVCFGIVGVAVSQLVNPPKNKPPQTEAIYGVATLFGIGALVAIYVGIRLHGLKYLVFPGHLAAVDAGSSTTIRWGQIREVFHAVHPAWRKYTIVTRAGKRLTLTGDTKDHTVLGDLIAERVAEVLLPEASRQLSEGRTLTFGPIQLSRAGLQCHGQYLPWHHVPTLTFGLNPRPSKGTSMVSNMIHLRLTPGCQVEMGEIPNYPLFEKLVRQLHPTCLMGAVG
jgi:hypothetical protein